MTAARTSVVVITHNRRSELIDNLRRLLELPERPPVIVVDNASADGSAGAVASTYSDVAVVDAGRNMGAAGRNLGVAHATTPYVAFSDDDSWWEPGSLRRAADLLDAHRGLALIAGRVVAPAGTVDATCEAMERSALPPANDLPGPRVRGFMACGAVVRRAPFLGVGGFDDMFGVGGEEGLLATDLAASGWELCYCADVTAVHNPSSLRDRAERRRRVVRNDLWYTWLRRRLPSAAATTFRTARGIDDPAVRGGFRDALARFPATVRRRRPVPAPLERELKLLDTARGAAATYSRS